VTLVQHPETAEPLRETVHRAGQSRQQAGAPPIRRVMTSPHSPLQTTERELPQSNITKNEQTQIPLRKFPVKGADLSARVHGIERVITRQRWELFATIHKLEREAARPLVRRRRSRAARPLVRWFLSAKPLSVRKYPVKRSTIRTIRSRVRASRRRIVLGKESAEEKLLDEITRWLLG
jgi:hypothetical protein